MPTLELTTMVGCPLKCTYCPQDLLKKTYGNEEKYLTLDNLRKVLAKVPKFVRIDFSGMAEPWANPDASAMLAHTLSEGFRVVVYSTLYGMEDPEEVVRMLTVSHDQVEAVVIHLPDANGNMRGFKQTPQWQAAFDAFTRLRDSRKLRHVKFMTMDAKGKVHPSLKISLPPWQGLTRAGTLDVSEINGQPVEKTPQISTPVSCSFTPFYDQNVMLPNGDVVVCCMDYSIKHKIGNLLQQNYYELFASQGMNELRVENMNFGHSDKSLCKSCSRAQRYDLPQKTFQYWELAH